MDSKAIVKLCQEALESNQKDLETMAEKIVTLALEKARSQGAELWDKGPTPDADLIASHLADILTSSVSYSVMFGMLDYAMPKREED